MSLSQVMTPIDYLVILNESVPTLERYNNVKEQPTTLLSQQLIL